MSGKIEISSEDYLDKVLACWYGKNIGGTLGAPFEWLRQENSISFYTQNLEGEPMANDDLDIQLLWLIALEEIGIGLDEHILADYWCNYVTPHWSEYGTAKINMRSGLLPPVSGAFRNAYKNSCGAFIRSEIWACIAPGIPEKAAEYAWMDGMLDHGSAEGTYAEVFCATLESAAFVIKDLDQLIKIALSYIPPKCGVAKAIERARELYEQGCSLSEARIAILSEFRGGGASLGNPKYTSAADRARGFDTGELGYDVPSNIAILVWSLLTGKNDFAKTICSCVNMGEDTDCTAATAGSIFGIIHGMQEIDKKWIEPIGSRIITACLNIGELGAYGSQLPQDVLELTRRTERIAKQVLLANPEAGVQVKQVVETPSAVSPSQLLCEGLHQFRYLNDNSVRHVFPFFTFTVDYGDKPIISSKVPKNIRIIIENNYKFQTNLSFRWYVPEDWSILPAATGQALSLTKRQSGDLMLSFTFECENVRETLSRCVFEVSAEGRPLIMHVPIQLLNGNMDFELTEFRPQDSPVDTVLYGEAD